MKLLVTGGAGFIGSNFVRMILREESSVEVVNLDRLTYAGNLENLAALEGDPRHHFLKGDIAEPTDLERAFALGPIDAVVHFAAESHVDRSILSAEPFLHTNVVGSYRLLEAARKAGVERFVHVSTDEVYGSLGPGGRFTETTPLDPSSPYSASKAASDLLVLAAYRTHGDPVIVTRCSNNYGPYQFPEKLVPLMVTNALEGEPLPVYGDGLQIRDWIHVEDHCRAVRLLLEKGRVGEVYNVGGEGERTNLDVIREILTATGRDASLIRHVPDRKAHDRRYAMDFSKIRLELGWEPRVPFAKGLRETVAWYRDHREWWERVKSGAYRKYYEEQYAQRLRAARSP